MKNDTNAKLLKIMERLADSYDRYARAQERLASVEERALAIELKPDPNADFKKQQRKVLEEVGAYAISFLKRMEDKEKEREAEAKAYREEQKKRDAELKKKARDYAKKHNLDPCEVLERMRYENGIGRLIPGLPATACGQTPASFDGIDDTRPEPPKEADK